MHNTNPTKTANERNVRSFFTAKSVLLGALLLAGTQSFAQKGFDFGLRAEVQGAGMLNTTDNAAGPELDLSYKASFAYGIAVGYTFSDHMGVEIGVMPSTQGQGYKGDPTKIDPTAVTVFTRQIAGAAAAHGIPLTGTSYTADMILKCTKIPILFRLTGVSSRSSYFSLLVGPQVNMLSSVKLKINGTDAGSGTTGYNKSTFDAVLAFGAGFMVSDNILITGHFRMDYGLGNIEDKTYVANGRASTHNATAGLMVGVAYKLVQQKNKTKTKTVEKTKK